jgi:transposase
MASWAKAPCGRDQLILFATTMDDRVPEDDPVRIFHEILSQMDWREWESYYVLVVGQPPIHPRVLASLILYGMTCGIRSSRRLEEACVRRVDFMWLSEDRRVDHSTLCQFRTRFGSELKALYRQLLELSMRVGLVSLNQVMLDGTKVLANSSRHGTASVGTLEQRLAALSVEIEEQFAAAAAADKSEDGLFGKDGTPSRLPRVLVDLKDRQGRLKKAFAAARAKAERGVKRPKAPVADPDSSVSPNKDGGFAPNYTPMLAVDAEAGMIVAADVLDGHDESEAPVPMVEAIRENTGQVPEQLLADSGFNSGPNLQALADQEVEAFIPSASRTDREDNPARRERLDESVPAADRERLPLDLSTKRLCRTAFIFDAAGNCYWCPMGQRLAFWKHQSIQRRKRVIEYDRYRCKACAGCELAERCLSPKASSRCINRDRHEPLREAMDARLRSASGKAVYRQRAPVVEGRIGVIKSPMGVRQFLLRGLAKVRTEWTWLTTACNLSILMRRWSSVKSRASSPA